RVVKEMHPHLETKPSPFGEYANLTCDPSTRFASGQRLRPVTLFHGGWGKISAAASAQYVIDHFKPDLLINLGTCGGFAGCIKTGTIILVDQTLVYDILEQMGDGAEAIEHYSTNIDLSWIDDGRLTMDDSGDGQRSMVRDLLVSADRDILVEDIPMLIEKYGAVAADWESGAIAWVANKNHTRLLILRGVTDLVGIDGGETYGNLGLFHERTKTVMHELFRQLPDWLNSIKI
ncbi:MAG: 5'-methylthioadenosine/S-adenosylhomocysteine nucleosidase, partial [Anaerolineales bacterium]|nr:5'-methylthioadenosine/S-adenosylhomocysteine nucleosidase [Anaerolineales bacterium]